MNHFPKLASVFWRTFALSFCLLSPQVFSAEPVYPNRSITLIVPYGAGSSTDILARVISKEMAIDLGHPIIVENRAGAGGTIGSAAVARSVADGYTLVMGTISSHSINESMMKSVPYRVLRDFTPISLVAYFPNLLAVNNDLPVSNLTELIALAKAKPGMSFATGGIASSGQLAGELFMLRTGTKLNHLPYKEVGQAVTDVIANHVPIIIYQVPALVSQIKANKLKALAVLAPVRTSLLPDLPTPGEQGIADFDATAWMGLFGPAKLPEGISATLQRSLAKVSARPEVVQQLARQGFTLAIGTSDQFRQFLVQDIAKWAAVIKETGATID